MDPPAGMPPPVVILSPHLDDAVLSCWRVLTGPADVHVINVFAGLPAPDAAPGWWDGRSEPRAMVTARRAEDAAALALTGRQPLNLPLLDRQYRDDDQQPAALIEALRPVLSPRARLLAPAALGPHPDHLVVRTAALDLRAEGFEVGLYADLPHACAHGWPDWMTQGAGAGEVDRAWEAALAATGLAADRRVPKVCRLAQAEFEHKIAAVRCYATQVRALERFFARRLDDPDLLGYEVTWRLAPAA